MIWHTPVYLILKHFKLMEAILKPFVWGKNRHKLPWQILKNPTDLAGMALPDFNLCNLAAQLSQLLFRYLQLHHAFRAQFSSARVSLANNHLMEAIKCPDPKKLISQFYSMLSLPQVMYQPMH